MRAVTFDKNLPRPVVVDRLFTSFRFGNSSFVLINITNSRFGFPKLKITDLPNIDNSEFFGLQILKIQVLEIQNLAFQD